MRHLILEAFSKFVASKGYKASMVDKSVVISHVNNPNNIFRVAKVNGMYAVDTLCLSPDDNEYSPKSIVYLLLEAYNKQRRKLRRRLLKFRVDMQNFDMFS